jgi:putative transposase
LLALECVGIHAAHRATRFEALEPVRQGVRRCFGAFGKGIARGLAVCPDHGSQYVSDHFQTELCFLGVESSPPRALAAPSASSAP